MFDIDKRPKRYHVLVVFTVERDIPHVRPPYVKGKRDSLWVSANSASKKDIIDAGERKLQLMVGLPLLKPAWGSGFWH